MRDEERNSADLFTALDSDVKRDVEAQPLEPDVAGRDRLDYISGRDDAQRRALKILSDVLAGAVAVALPGIGQLLPGLLLGSNLAANRVDAARESYISSVGNESNISLKQQSDSRPLADADTVTFKLVFNIEEPEKTIPLTPQTLTYVVAPYLASISNIQRVIDEIKKRSPRRYAIYSIVSGTVSVSMGGVGEAVNAGRDLFTPWRRENAKRMAELAEQEKQAEIEKKRAEVLEVRATAAKTREEAEGIAAEATLKREQAEQIRLQNESLRQELALRRAKLALDLVKEIAPDMSPEQQLAYTLRLTDDLKVLLESPLQIAPALPSRSSDGATERTSDTPKTTA